MNMAKLSIKGLIESALNLGRTLDSDYAPLQQFFVVMEHCLKHGLKSMYNTLHRASIYQNNLCSCKTKVMKVLETNYFSLQKKHFIC